MNTGIQQTLLAYVEDITGKEIVDPHADFADLDLTSLNASQLISHTLQLYGVKLPIITLFQPETANVAALARYIEAKLRAE